MKLWACEECELGNRLEPLLIDEVWSVSSATAWLKVKLLAEEIWHSFVWMVWACKNISTISTTSLLCLLCVCSPCYTSKRQFHVFICLCRHLATSCCNCSAENTYIIINVFIIKINESFRIYEQTNVARVQQPRLALSAKQFCFRRKYSRQRESLPGESVCAAGLFFSVCRVCVCVCLLLNLSDTAVLLSIMVYSCCPNWLLSGECCSYFTDWE